MQSKFGLDKCVRAPLGKKGFVISVDVLISLMMVSFIIVASLFYLSQVTLTSWNSVDLLNVTQDEAMILDKSAVFETSLSQNSAEPILASINASPENYCFEVSVFSQSDFTLPLLHTIKTGCVKRSSDLSSVEQTFVVHSGGSVLFYVARIEGWIKS